jgi:predicted nucleotidyltransferase
MAVAIEWREEAPERTAEMAREAHRTAAELGRLGAHLVLLFGSRARGNPTARSDIDLLVVMDCDPSWTFARRLAEVGSWVDPRYATDLLVYTPEELASLRERSAWMRGALAEGRVLHRRAEPASRGSHSEEVRR